MSCKIHLTDKQSKPLPLCPIGIIQIFPVGMECPIFDLQECSRFVQQECHRPQIRQPMQKERNLGKCWGKWVWGQFVTAEMQLAFLGCVFQLINMPLSNQKAAAVSMVPPPPGDARTPFAAAQRNQKGNWMYTTARSEERMMMCSVYHGCVKLGQKGFTSH